MKFNLPSFLHFCCGLKKFEIAPVGCASTTTSFFLFFFSYNLLAGLYTSRSSSRSSSESPAVTPTNDVGSTKLAVATGVGVTCDLVLDPVKKKNQKQEKKNGEKRNENIFFSFGSFSTSSSSAHAFLQMGRISGGRHTLSTVAAHQKGTVGSGVSHQSQNVVSVSSNQICRRRRTGKTQFSRHQFSMRLQNHLQSDLLNQSVQKTLHSFQQRKNKNTENRKNRQMKPNSNATLNKQKTHSKIK